MTTFELDKWTIRQLIQYIERTRLDIRPPYQRQRRWSNAMRYALIDSVLKGYPMGVLLLDVIATDEHGNPRRLHNYATVDGQQRTAILVEYVTGSSDWTTGTPPRGVEYTPYGELEQAQQDMVDDYKVPVALLTGYSEESIREIFRRVQYEKL